MPESDDIRSLKISLVSYALVLAMKLAAYFITGVMALLAEALHTLSDIFVSGFLLVAAYYSRKSADQAHMFGHGRVQNIAALTAAVLFISFTSYKLYEESIPRLFQPGEAVYQNLWLALVVILLSIVLAAVPLIQLLRQKQRGPAAKAQLTESINDELGLLAALVGIVFIMWGKPIADPIASIVVATVIAFNGVKLFIENFSCLVGRSPGPEKLAEIERAALAVPGVLEVHDLRAEFIGPEVIHVDMHIQVAPGTPVEEVDRIAHEVEAKIHADISPGYSSIHVDPADKDPQLS